MCGFDVLKASSARKANIVCWAHEKHDYREQQRLKREQDRMQEEEVRRYLYLLYHCVFWSWFEEFESFFADSEAKEVIFVDVARLQSHVDAVY